MNNEQGFYEGFADSCGSTVSEARDAWAWWPRQLGDVEREAIEGEGYESGVGEGHLFCLMSKSQASRSNDNE